MQIEIAKKNDEARAIEQKLNEQMNQTSTCCWRLTMQLLKNSLLLTVLFVLVGCASQPQVAYKPPQVPPLPPEIGTKREVNLTDRLTKLLMPTEQPSQQSQK
jgi:hypothetical protein